jgi:hypothetical protein
MFSNENLMRYPGSAQPLGKLGQCLEPRFHKAQKENFKALFFCFFLFFFKAKQKIAYKFEALKHALKKIYYYLFIISKPIGWCYYSHTLVR